MKNKFQLFNNLFYKTESLGFIQHLQTCNKVLQYEKNKYFKDQLVLFFGDI